VRAAKEQSLRETAAMDNSLFGKTVFGGA